MEFLIRLTSGVMKEFIPLKLVLDFTGIVKLLLKLFIEDVYIEFFA